MNLIGQIGVIIDCRLMSIVLPVKANYVSIPTPDIIPFLSTNQIMFFL